MNNFRLTIFFTLTSVSTLLASLGLEEAFRSPPEQTRPWCYWYWINDNISKEGVTKDLEAMAATGIGTALIGNQWFKEQPQGPNLILSEEWWDITVHAIQEGRRLGIDIGMFNSAGWSMSGGPWVKPEQGMRYLYTVEKRVTGPATLETLPPAPDDTFEDVALLAIPAPAEQVISMANATATISGSTPSADANPLIDGEPSTGITIPPSNAKEPLRILIQTKEDFTARSLTLYPGEGFFRSEVTVEALVDEDWKTIREATYDRRRKNNDVGPIPHGPVYIALPKTTTDRFRVSFSPRVPERGAPDVESLSEITFSSSPRVEYAIEKQLGKMYPRPLPKWDSYIWPEPPAAAKGESITQTTDVLDFTGQDSIDLPEGDWIVQRIGMRTNNIKNSPASPRASGLEVDKLSRKPLAAHFDAYVGELLRRIPDEDKAAFKYVVGDSYEKGSQNWTDQMEDIFKEAYGYDPIPFLPTLSGYVVQSADASDRFLWDLRRLVADRVATEYVGGLRELSNQHGLKVWLENYGHWGFPSEFMKYGGQSDLVAGEFWATGNLGNIECRAAASTAHAYGKNVVYAEAFTSGTNWEYAPFDLKKRGDWAFTEGINHMVLHLYIQQPDDTKPGMNAWFGTGFNRNNTWFHQGRDWLDYLQRCHILLQQGQHVADVAYFIGEDAPIMTGTRQPELPVGFDFDYINAEVLIERMSVKDGRWTLPDGKSYALMVLPPLETMRPSVIKKLHESVSQGAPLYGPAPRRSPSLQNAEKADKQVARHARKIWGGSYQVFDNTTLQEAMDSIGLRPDVGNIPAGDILWIHRRSADADFYFLSNQKQETVSIDPIFRVSKDRQPEFWHADTGKMERMGKFNVAENGIQLPLTLDPAGSVFVVFRNPEASSHLPLKTVPTEQKATLPLSERDWTLSFMPGRDVPDTIELEEIALWTEQSDPAIVHYSGTASYRTTFTLPKDWVRGDSIRQFLDLGTVAPMARVHLNGKDLGLLWKPPYVLDITDALKPGENSLELEVTNLWSNRMIAERDYPDGFPGKEGQKEFTARSSFPTRRFDQRTLQDSGIEGPVQILNQRVSPLLSETYPRSTN
jgi:hypothetical protein